MTITTKEQALAFRGRELIRGSYHVVVFDSPDQHLKIHGLTITTKDIQDLFESDPREMTTILNMPTTKGYALSIISIIEQSSSYFDVKLGKLVYQYELRDEDDNPYYVDTIGFPIK